MTTGTLRQAPSLIEKDGIKILTIADIRGELSLFNKLAEEYGADIIIHTGNFGFLDQGSVDRIHESYLRHIVEFSPLLPEELIIKISKLSKVTGDNVEHLSNETENLKTLLKDQPISELSDFIDGKSTLNIPVYTIYGMCEDSLVIDKFKYGIYSIPNLHIVDDAQLHTVETLSGQVILIAGIGGSLSYHKLFHQGSAIELRDIIGDQESFEDLDPDGLLLPVSGDSGNIWITFLQMGKLIHTITQFAEEDSAFYERAIKIFVTHQSPAREPLLEHLSIFFKMDYTISNSLHFKYTSSYNQLSINPSFESFKLKFNEARTKLAVIWKHIQPKFEILLFKLNDPMMIAYVELALAVFDKIPVSPKSLSEDIPSLTMSQELDEESSYKSREFNTIIRQLNDLYYIAFQNTWHLNLCDLSYGTVVLDLQNGKMKMICESSGYNFTYRQKSMERNGDSISSTTSPFSAAGIQLPKTSQVSNGDDNGSKTITNGSTSSSKSATGTPVPRKSPTSSANTSIATGTTTSSPTPAPAFNSSSPSRGRGRGRGGYKSSRGRGAYRGRD